MLGGNLNKLNINRAALKKDLYEKQLTGSYIWITRKSTTS